MSITLDPGQQAAIDTIGDFLQDEEAHVAVLTGYAGCGKTSLIKYIAEQFGEPIVLTPTGKAALRVTEATGLTAITIHRFLYNAQTDEKTGAPIFTVKDHFDLLDFSGRLIVIDESSMVGKDTFDTLLSVARQVNFQILLVGDNFQLPPVAKIKDGFSALDFDTKYRATLTEVHRQALESPIIRASMILRSNRPEHEAMSLLTPIGASKLTQTLLDVRSKGGAVICHTNKRRHAINLLARQAMGYVDGTLEAGEPIMVIKNNYSCDKYNGEILNFDKWEVPGLSAIAVDRYTVSSLNMDFGVGSVEGSSAMLSTTEITGKSEEAKIGFGAIAKAAKFAYRDYSNYGSEEDPAPSHLHANYGYALTTHKCVHPGTLIEVDGKITEISNIQSSGTVSTALGEESYFNKSYNLGDSFIRITTASGYGATVTPDHFVFVWDGEEFIKKEANKLSSGDILRLKLGTNNKKSEIPMYLPPQPMVDTRATEILIPEILTNDVAEFLGLFVSDGCIAPHRISFVKAQKEVVERFAELLIKLFGLITFEIEQVGGAWLLTCQSTMLERWLRLIGGLEPHNKYICKYILEADLELQAAFLKGLFEDGTVNIKIDELGNENLDHIEWSNHRKEVVSMVQVLLLRYGIISSTPDARKRGEKLQYVLYIYGANAKKFLNKIGFISYEKNNRLTLPHGNESRYMIPVNSEEIQLLNENISKFDKNNLRDRKAISRHKMEQVAEKCGEWAMAKLSWHYEVVKYILPAPTGTSMCITVPTSGRFLQNGFDFGNSQGSQFPEILFIMERSLGVLKGNERKRLLYTAITRGIHSVKYVYLDD